MIFTSFEGLVAYAKAHVKARRVVVAAAQDEHTLEAVMKVRAEGIVVPVLVGDKEKIQEILAKMGESVPEEDLYDAISLRTCVEKRISEGGTSLSSVEKQIAWVKQFL